jgi:hypothetical protein
VVANRHRRVDVPRALRGVNIDALADL